MVTSEFSGKVNQLANWSVLLKINVPPVCKGQLQFKTQAFLGILFERMTLFPIETDYSL